MPANAPEPPSVVARDHAVACDVSPLALLAVTGLDAATFLHGQLSSDVTGLALDACQYTSYNSPGGRMLANFVLWRAGAGPADGFRALVPADIAEPLRRRLAMFVLRARVSLSDLSPGFARLGIGGPGARDALAAAFGAVPAVFALARHGETEILGLPGLRYIVVTPQAASDAVAATLAAHTRRATFEAWQWLTIRAGVPVIGAAVQDRFVPQTANWDVLGGVNFQKGCYTGQEIVARTQYLGRLKERLFAFHAPSGHCAPGERLFSAAFAEQPCGTVVNAARAPEGGWDLLAVLQLAAAASGDVRLGAEQGPPLAALPLPYPVPPPADPRGRSAARAAGT
jgi:folate-binding protein YgfZ